MEGLAAAEVVGRGNNLSVKHGDDSNFMVTFYFNKRYQRDFIRMISAGQKNTIWDEPVKPEYKSRFSKQWEQYQAQLAQVGHGIPIEKWDELSEPQVNVLKALNIRTIENLCSVADGAIEAMGPGMRELQRKAKLYLADAKATQEKEAAEQELRKRDSKIDVLEQELAQMRKQMAQLLNQAAPPVQEAQNKTLHLPEKGSKTLAQEIPK
jgi:hypothetical protein